jgi:hypothetical protein
MNTQQEEHSEMRINQELPIWIRLRNYIFDSKKPDVYTQVTFYLSITIWSIFFCWSTVSYFAIYFREIIYEQKKISVESIIESRGEVLGFTSGEFLDKLVTYHFISIICWTSVFVGLVLLWRKNIKFVFFFFGGTLLYFGMILFYLNFNYYKEDTTFFDKVIFLALNLNVLMYSFLLQKEKKGGNLSFFGENPVD